MEEKTNKAKLEHFQIFEKIGRIAFDKISRNCVFYGKSINIL